MRGPVVLATPKWNILLLKCCDPRAFWGGDAVSGTVTTMSSPPSLTPSACHRGMDGKALLWEAPGGAPGRQRAGDRLPRGGMCDDAPGVRHAGGGGSHVLPPLTEHGGRDLGASKAGTRKQEVCGTFPCPKACPTLSCILCEGSFPSGSLGLQAEEAQSCPGLLCGGRAGVLG